MPIVTFYQLDDNSQDANQDILKACSHLLLETLKKRKWATVLCTNKQQAEDVDEFVWQHPVDSVIPHNLAGEGPKQGTPAEITWLGQALNSRHTLINLSQSMIDNYRQYQHIIDFVPVEETQKQQARERYKQYKLAGCNMQFTPANQINESN
ncbi:MAG: DNA polymerase-3 subunit chi [Methylophagaceae bacterium]|jgi:DNA polymerase-3 subunit chi